MAPLLKPSECILLVFEPASKEPDSSDALTPSVVEYRRRIEQAACICGVPVFVAAHDSPQTSSSLEVEQPSRGQVPVLLETFSQSWPDTPLGAALAATGRPCLLLCGWWMDEYVTFAAHKAFAAGYDTYVLTDATPSLHPDSYHTALMRMVQAGIVPTTVRQVIREWAFLEADQQQCSQLRDLLASPDG